MMGASFIPESIIAFGAGKYTCPSVRRRLAKRIATIFAGFALGAVNGCFGSGGGMLAVPVLTFLMGMEDKKAHATAIAVILPLCAISVAIYSARASFDALVVLPTVIGVFVGGILGAELLKKIPSQWLSFVFYGLMLLAGIKMVAE